MVTAPPSEGVAHSLFAKALADADDHKVVLVTCDIIAFRHVFTKRVRERVEAKYGLPRASVALFASHCHSGPTPVEPTGAVDADGPPREGFEANAACTRHLEDKIVNLIGAALAEMKPASLSYDVGRAHFALNRREPTDRGIRLGKYPRAPSTRACRSSASRAPTVVPWPSSSAMPATTRRSAPT
jgi:hypothetical protein